jgi:class 3 adenylate cyclase
MERPRLVELPTGEVTLLFSDIEGSTRMLNELGDVYGDVLATHHQLLREAWLAAGGVEVSTEGDAFFVAFSDARAAVDAATAAQRVLATQAWPEGRALRVRMGVHTGSPKVRGDDYWGIDVHYAARLCSAANGGQVLLSESTAALVDADLEDLGEHALKDFPASRRVFQLVVDGQRSDRFAPVRTLRAGRTNLPDQLSSFLGREPELDEVCRLLESHRMVTLVGTGGVGKTRLALAAAARLLDGTGDGVWLVELAPLHDADLVGAAVATALRVDQ